MWCGNKMNITRIFRKLKDKGMFFKYLYKNLDILKFNYIHDTHFLFGGCYVKI